MEAVRLTKVVVEISDKTEAVDHSIRVGGDAELSTSLEANTSTVDISPAPAPATRITESRRLHGKWGRRKSHVLHVNLVFESFATVFHFIYKEIYLPYLLSIWKHKLFGCFKNYASSKFWDWVDSAPD